MGLLERYKASPHQQSINTALMLAGLLSISIPLVVEGVHFIVRLRRRKGKRGRVARLVSLVPSSRRRNPELTAFFSSHPNPLLPLFP